MREEIYSGPKYCTSTNTDNCGTFKFNGTRISNFFKKIIIKMFNFCGEGTTRCEIPFLTSDP